MQMRFRGWFATFFIISLGIRLNILERRSSPQMKTGPPSEGAEEESNTYDESSIFIEILEKCRNGATKEELINAIPLLSHSNLQFRRSTAELVDRRLLIYDEKQHVFITTDKGILFLNSAKKI